MAETDEDRYPVLSEVLSRIMEDSELAGDAVERIEINLHATGEANCRVWAPRAEEAEILYYPPASSPS
jgi:hypothetical protein